MKFKVRIAVIIINIVAMMCGLLIVSVSVKDRTKLATTLPLEKDKYEEINALFKKYINAKKSENFKELAECTNNLTEQEKQEIKKENIVSNKVENIHCYTIDGYYENTYVVFLYKEDVWNDINVKVPAITRHYVCEYKGKLVIYSGIVNNSKKTAKINEYIQLTKENPDVVKLVKDAEEATKQLTKTNEAFKKLYDQYNQSANNQDDPAASNAPATSNAPSATPVPSFSADPSDAIG